MCVEVLSCARGRVGRGRPTYSLRCPETGAGNRPVENESGNGWNMKIATLRSQ
jgi:hypothetical protein